MKDWIISGVMAVLIACAAWGVSGVVSTHAEHAPISITSSPGGAIFEFMAKYDKLRESGRKVRIDGLCVSACTLVTGLVPAERVCVTPYGTMAFHSAAIETPLGDVYSKEGTELIWNIYPESIHKLLKAKGWDGASAHPELIYVTPK